MESGSPFCELTCRVCHERFRPGDRILHVYHRGMPRAIHAFPCQPASPAPAEPPGIGRPLPS